MRHANLKGKQIGLYEVKGFYPFMVAVPSPATCDISYLGERSFLWSAPSLMWGIRARLL